MEIVNKIKKLESYICQNFEAWDMEDPIEEGYFEEYQDMEGASEEDFINFEEKYQIKLSDDFKQVYQYKNGSQNFELLPLKIDDRMFTFSLMSLEEMDEIKDFFQNTNALLSDFPDLFREEDIKRLEDGRIKPYLHNKRWFPFARSLDFAYLMIDDDPGLAGKRGQIIFYLHDPDEILYLAESISDLFELTVKTSVKIKDKY